MVLGLSLLVLAFPLWAEWTMLSETGNGTWYVDFATLRKKGNVAKIWALLDYKQTQFSGSEKGYRSQMSYMEFDCEQEYLRTLNVASYSQSMGTGDLMGKHRFDSPEWEPVPPGKIATSLWNAACDWVK